MKRIESSYLKELRDGEPCNHKGCLCHISHPCEGCGRVGGKQRMTKPTGAQIDYFHLLMAQLGYDEADLGIEGEDLSRQRVSELIDQLKEELYG